MAKPPIVVGIAGGSASGKSTVVHEVTRILGPGASAIVSHDAYYHDLSHMAFEERLRVNVDHPESVETSLLIEHIGELIAGRPIEVPDYDFVSQTRAARGIRVEPASVVIVEGLFTLVDERLRALLHVKAYVDTTPAQRLERRIERDVVERGRDRPTIVHQHETRVQPMHERFVAPSRAHADVLIEGGGHNVAAIAELAERVRRMLR